MADSLDVSRIEILSEHIHREMQPTGKKGSKKPSDAIVQQRTQTQTGLALECSGNGSG